MTEYFEGFSEDLLDDMAKLEPFGNGNPEPIFELEKVEAVEVRAVGKEGNHLRMIVMDPSGQRMTLVAFSAPEEWLNTPVNSTISVVIQVVRNEWNGRVSVEGRILDLKSI